MGGTTHFTNNAIHLDDVESRFASDSTSLLKGIWEIWKNTVLDNARLLQATAGADGSDDRQQAGCPFPRQVPHYPSLAKTGVKGLRIGRLSEGLDRPLTDKRVSDLVVKAAKALAQLGAVDDEVSVPFHKEASDIWARIVPLKQEQLDDMFPTGVNTIINGLWGSDNMPPTVSPKKTCTHHTTRYQT
ncbi:hypothetical protein JCM24511_05294 [Saitozyma sp. JCM 24511]|nr:hypothetical protein JCM24511_05294 [Saitozyma sp. JCM 24511]